MQGRKDIKFNHERREYMIFSNNLKRIRKESNLSQEQIADQYQE